MRTVAMALAVLMMLGAAFVGEAQSSVASRQHGYTVTPPAGWKSRHTPGGEVDLALLSPKQNRGGQKDPFIENLTLIVKPKSDGQNARRAANNGVTSLRRRLKDFRIVEQGRFRVDSGADAYRIVYEGVLDEQRVRNTAYAIVGDAIVLTITGSATAQTHADYTSAFDRAVASVTFAKSDNGDPAGLITHNPNPPEPVH